jgi:hypothetical protein
LAHTPSDSTLAEIISTYQLGINSDALTTADLSKGISRIREYQLSERAFEEAHTALFGFENVNRMVACFDNNHLARKPTRD